MAVHMKQTRYVPVPTGEYLARLESITSETGSFGTPQLKWRFNLVGEDFEGRSLTGWCGMSFTPKSKAFRWTSAVLGGWDIPEEWDFDSDVLIGRHAVLVVITQDGDSGEFNKIADLKPAPRQAPKAPPMPANGQTVKTQPAPTVQASVPVVRAAAGEPPPMSDAELERLAQRVDLAEPF